MRIALILTFYTANIFHRGFHRLRAEAETATTTVNDANQIRRQGSGSEGALDYEGREIEYTAYFPFASAQTSNTAARLLAPEPTMDDLFSLDTFPDGMNLDFGAFFEPFGNLADLESCL